MRRHSSGAGKRHDGISEIAPDIFACSVYIYWLPAHPSVSSPSSSPSSSISSSCSFQVLAIETPGDGSALGTYLDKPTVSREMSRLCDVGFEFE